MYIYTYAHAHAHFASAPGIKTPSVHCLNNREPEAPTRVLRGWVQGTRGDHVSRLWITLQVWKSVAFKFVGFGSLQLRAQGSRIAGLCARLMVPLL